MFKSFLQAGFECSSHRLRSGHRLDLIHSTAHDRFVAEDYARLRVMGIATVREGLRWHLIEAQPGQYDFRSVVPFIEAANESEIEVIWDLFHFGWPDHLDIFDPQWVRSFAALSHQFALLWRRLCGDQPAFIAPINEISFFSWAAGDIGILNPFARERGVELKKQLVRGFLSAAEAIRQELPNARIVAPEPVIHIVSDPSRPEDVVSAEGFRLSMFEAWDMLSGRLYTELGGHTSALDVIGVNYYDRNQWRNYGETSDLQSGKLINCRTDRRLEHTRCAWTMSLGLPAEPRTYAYPTAKCLSAVLSAEGPSLMCFPLFSAISPSRSECSKQAKNEKNNHRRDLTRMVS